MKQTNTFSWMRLLRSVVAMTMVMAMLLLCGCNSNNKEETFDAKEEAHIAVNNATKLYGDLLSAIAGDEDNATGTGTEMNLTVSLGEGLLSQLAMMLEANGMDPDVSWLSEISLTMNTVQDKDLSQMGISASLSGQTILSANVIMDMAGQMAYIGVPELNPQYIGQSVAMGGMVGSAQSLLMEMAKDPDFIKALPTQAEFSALLTRYVDLLLEQLPEPTKTTETLSHGNVSQEVTAHTYTISRSNVLDLAEQLLKTVQSDAQLEQAMDSLSAYYNQQGAAQAEEIGYTWYDVDLHQELMLEIEAGLRAISEEREELEDATALVYTIYAAGAKQVGMRLTLHEEEKIQELYGYKLTSGSNTALVLDFLGKVHLSGTGTNQDNKVNGTYKLVVDNIEMMTIELVDFDENALNEGELKGTVRLSPSDAMMENADGMMSVLASPTLELNLDVGGEAANISCKLYSAGILVLGVDMSSKPISGATIQVPAEYANGDDYADMQAWQNALSFETVLSNLQKAGASEELVEMLRQALGGSLG